MSAERPYARMVLPYYLKGSISESHVYTLNPTRLRTLDVEAYLGRRAAQLDTQANTLTLDDDTVIPYDDLLIATGSSPVRARCLVLTARAQFLDAGTGAGGHSTDPSGQLGGHGGGGVYRVYDPQCHFSHGAKLSVEIGPAPFARMIDPQGAVVEQWLRDRGGDPDQRPPAGHRGRGTAKTPALRGSEDLLADLVIMATGIRTNLDWLKDAGLTINRGILVDAQQRSNVPNVYAAGDAAEGKDLITGQPAIHAIEPTAMEHGRIAGANMAGQPWPIAAAC